MQTFKKISIIGLITMAFSSNQLFASTDQITNQQATTQSMIKSTSDQLNQPGGLLKSFRIHYPPKAQRESVEGWVKLQFDINERGYVADVKVLDAYPSRTFEQAAINGVKDWQFKPKTINGLAVAYQHQQTIDFELINYTMVDGKHVVGKQ